jgi:hypothetical protein
VNISTVEVQSCKNTCLCRSAQCSDKLMHVFVQCIDFTHVGVQNADAQLHICGRYLDAQVHVRVQCTDTQWNVHEQRRDAQLDICCSA